MGSPIENIFLTPLIYHIQTYPSFKIAIIKQTEQTSQFFPSDILFDAAMSYVKNVCINQIVVLEHLSSAKMHVYKYSTLYLYDDDM